jgi:hypothetical protein
MIKLYCEGKYDSIYINRIVEYYKLSNTIEVEPLGGKEKVYGKYMKNSTDLYVVDIDFRLSKTQDVKIKTSPTRFILMKFDLEEYFFDTKGKNLTKREKKDLSYQFRDFSDKKITSIINSRKNLEIFEVIKENQTCSNIALVFQKIRDSSPK